MKTQLLLTLLFKIKHRYNTDKLQLESHYFYSYLWYLLTVVQECGYPRFTG